MTEIEKYLKLRGGFLTCCLYQHAQTSSTFHSQSANLITYLYEQCQDARNFTFISFNSFYDLLNIIRNNRFFLFS